MQDLTKHLTARADDSHAAPVMVPDLTGDFPFRSLLPTCQALVRFFALIELNHTLRCLCGPPSIPLSFSLAAVLPRGILNALALAQRGSILPIPSIHRLQCGLPGYLILFAPHTFGSERQKQPRRPPSPLVFLSISTHSTTTPRILPPPAVL